MLKSLYSVWDIFAKYVVTELVIKPKIEELAKYLADVIDDVR